MTLAIWLSVSFCGSALAGGEIEVDRTLDGPFSLVDSTGRGISDVDFRGRYMLVFFGYASCPDVCPTDLHNIGQALRRLGDTGEAVQPIFITVDPRRDRGELLARFVSYFHPRFLGLTGTDDQVAEAAQNYGVIYMRMGNADGDSQYTVDHSAFTYLLGPDGYFIAAFEHGTAAETMAEGIRRYLNPNPK